MKQNSRPETLEQKPEPKTFADFMQDAKRYSEEHPEKRSPQRSEPLTQEERAEMIREIIANLCKLGIVSEDPAKDGEQA